MGDPTPGGGQDTGENAKPVHRKRSKQKSMKRKLLDLWRRVQYPVIFVATCMVVVWAIRHLAED